VKHIVVLALVAAAVGACASENQTQAKLEPSYYQPPSSAEASAQPAIIEGTIEQTRRRGGLPRLLYEPDSIDQVCAYVFSVDGQMVGARADCTAAVSIAPGKHTIAAWLEGNRYFPPSRSPQRSTIPATATLMFDAEEGHRYKISLDGLDFNTLRARIWITDVTTQTTVTEATLATTGLGPTYTPYTPRGGGAPDGGFSPGTDAAFAHDK